MVNACSPQPFVGTQQFEIPYGTTINTLSRINKGLGFEWTLHVCKRCSMPIYGVDADTSVNPDQIVTKTIAGGTSTGICDTTQKVLYLAGKSFVAAAVVFDDAAMTIPHAGDDFIVDPSDGDIWSINNVTGALIAVVIINGCPTSVVGAESLFNFAPSTKGNEGALVDIYYSVYLASLARAQNTVNPPNIYNSVNNPDYGLLLYNKIGSDQCLLNRYLEVANKARTFFQLHAALAFDFATYQQLGDLTARIMRESDKQMSIPPGDWTFLPGSPAQASLEAWFAADANLVGLFSIETVTT